MQHSSAAGAGAMGLARPAYPHDPIEDARRVLRSAARLPYTAARPNAWLRLFRSQLGTARRSLVHHALRGERPDAEIRAFGARQPRLLPMAERQLAEHTELLRRACALLDEADRLDRPDIFRMVALSEETMALAVAVEHHQRRLSELAFEATHRDLGAGG